MICRSWFRLFNGIISEPTTTPVQCPHSQHMNCIIHPPPKISSILHKLSLASYPSTVSCKSELLYIAISGNTSFGKHQVSRAVINIPHHLAPRQITEQSTQMFRTNRELERWLIADVLTVLTEDSSTDIKWLTTAFNYSSKESNAPF